jgi:ubiquinone/menaquinone biosynthesis C-methylase UbiE
MIAVTAELHLAGKAFDELAESYDSVFTASIIGRSQRTAVWNKAVEVFRAGDRVLELNCGTGEDALFLARRGISITACDASGRMIEQARARKAEEAPGIATDFHQLSTESLDQLPSEWRFDGVFSNFSGLNCVADLQDTAQLLERRVYSGAPLLLCLSTRFCLWEIVHYLFKGEIRKAFRRCSGVTEARFGGHSFFVYYPTLRSLVRSFRPMFRLRSVTGIGIAVPPSYKEAWARKNPPLFYACEAIDRGLCRLPGFRVIGDHMLLHLERI